MNKNVDNPLSGRDIKNFMQEMNERPNLIFNNDITNDSNAESIFKNSGHAIIYHDWGTDTGHWLCAVRKHDKNKQGFNKEGEVYFFDSFGESPNYYNKNIVKALLKDYKKVNYNDIKLQSDDANTCGKHCLMICAYNKLGLGASDIDKILKKMKNKKVNFDKLAIDIIKK